MASLKDLRNRIAATKATQKITKAMQMVAASKLRRAQAAAEAARPYAARMDRVLANITIYWLTNTAGSSIRFYYENAKAKTAADGPTTVPIGLATFAGDFGGVRRFAEREHTNIVQWNTYEQPGGHYAAHLETDLLANDIRNFFTQLLGRKATHGLGCD